jgi:ParB family chromosome partitioning protein
MNQFKPIEEMFGLEDEVVQESVSKSKKGNEVVNLKIDSLVDYRKGNIGGDRYSQKDMEDLICSIKENGVLVPAVVRPIENNQYEIILGHHRKDGSIEAGLDELPCIIREMNDDEAEIAMMESNLQKGLEILSHSEKAELIFRRNEALKHQGKRIDLEENQEEVETTEKEFHLSRSTITRYLKIYTLTDEIKELLDTGRIAIRAAVNISNIEEGLQKHLHWMITQEDVKVSAAQSIVLASMQTEGILNQASMEEVLKKEKKEVKRKPYKLPKSIYKKYFTEEQESQEVTETIMKALDNYFNVERTDLDE